MCCLQIEREVTEAMMKSLKYCDVETASARQPLCQYRAATIHHRLASMYHSCLRNQVHVFYKDILIRNVCRFLSLTLLWVIFLSLPVPVMLVKEMGGQLGSGIAGTGNYKQQQQHCQRFWLLVFSTLLKCDFIYVGVPFREILHLFLFLKETEGNLQQGAQMTIKKSNRQRF